jgi:RHS repeat-associated protein
LLNGQTNVWSYTYDSSGRLTGAVKNGVAYSSYTYDSNSNRIGGFVGAQPTTATYDSQDRLTQYNIFNYTYKSNGDLYQKKNTLTNYMNSYIFDTYGNFKKYYNGDLPASSYDHDGRNRIAGRLWNGNNVYARYIYKDQYHIAGELNDTSQLSKRFVYASKSNIPDYMIVGGVNYRIISDNLGSQRLVIRLTDGAVSSWMDHDEFGKVTGSYNAYLPFGFAGGYYNANDGLVRFGARTYDPEVGRWLSKDPILFNGGDTNLYGYVAQDPVNFFDPSGLKIYDPDGVIPEWIKKTPIYKRLDSAVAVVILRNKDLNDIDSFGATNGIAFGRLQTVDIDVAANANRGSSYCSKLTGVEDTILHEFNHANLNLSRYSGGGAETEKNDNLLLPALMLNSSAYKK